MRAGLALLERQEGVICHEDYIGNHLNDEVDLEPHQTPMELIPKISASAAKSGALTVLFGK